MTSTNSGFMYESKMLRNRCVSGIVSTETRMEIIDWYLPDSAVPLLVELRFDEGWWGAQEFKNMREVRQAMPYFLKLTRTVILVHVRDGQRYYCVHNSQSHALGYINSFPEDQRTFHETWSGSRPHKIHIDFDMKLWETPEGKIKIEG